MPPPNRRICTGWTWKYERLRDTHVHDQLHGLSHGMTDGGDPRRLRGDLRSVRVVRVDLVALIRPLLATALLGAVVVGGFVVGAINTITEETWPDW